MCVITDVNDIVVAVSFNCILCNRETPIQFQEYHHLVPKAKKGKQTIMVCNPCGDQIHKLFENWDLKMNYNTIEKLKSHPKVQSWLKWISKRNTFTVSMKHKKKR